MRPTGTIRRPARPRPLKSLDQRHDVAFAVLEPGGLGTARGDGAGGAPFSRHVVVLEHHAPGLEGLDLAVYVIDGPEGLAGLGGSGIRRRVQETRGALAELVDHAAVDLLLGLETQ